MILVTGATGHIGNVLVRELLSRGEVVRALLLPGEDDSPLQGLDVEKVEGDVLDLGSLQRAFVGVQDVYHLAGIISIMPGENQQVWKVNVEGTRNILQAAHLTGIRRLIYTSSIHAFQRVPHGIVIDENIPFDPEHAISTYDRSKAQASLEVLDAAHQGLNAVIVCPTGVIGPYDFRGSEMGYILRTAAESKPQLLVDGSYDFVDVRDVARGLVQAGEKGRSGECYILSGERISLVWMVQAVRQYLGIRTAMLKIPMTLARFAANFAPWYYRLARTTPRLTPYSIATVLSNSVICNAKARLELGYFPRSLGVTIRDTVRWFLKLRAEFI